MRATNAYPHVKTEGARRTEAQTCSPRHRPWTRAGRPGFRADGPATGDGQGIGDRWLPPARHLQGHPEPGHERAHRERHPGAPLPGRAGHGLLRDRRPGHPELHPEVHGRAGAVRSPDGEAAAQGSGIGDEGANLLSQHPPEGGRVEHAHRAHRQGRCAIARQHRVDER